MPLPPGYSESFDPARGAGSVEAAWQFYGDRPSTHRVLPDGRCDLILTFASDGARVMGPITVNVVGPSTRFHDEVIAAGQCYVGARLRPAAASSVLSLPLKTLVNTRLMGEAALSLLPALVPLSADAQRVEDVIRRLETFVENRRGEAVMHAASPVIDALHVTGGRMPMAEVAGLLTLNIRSMHRYVVDATGLTPKQLSMVIQFHRALRLIRDEKLNVASTAIEAGYADQAHMTRVFRNMGGVTPGALPSLVLARLPIAVSEKFKTP